MSRIYHHYEQLEEYTAGMWQTVRGNKRKELIDKAASLMRDIVKFEECMLKAIRVWIKSCEHNLSAEAVNKIAWLGHAGCCIGCCAPEEATRAAWHTLSQDEQARANAAAKRVLAMWISPATLQLELFENA